MVLPGGAADLKVRFERQETFRRLRCEGLTEPQAFEAIERDEVGRDENDLADLRFELHRALEGGGFLDAWPVGWTEEEVRKLADHMTFSDVVYWVLRIIDAPHEKVVLAVLLSAQGYLAPALRAIGGAVHVVAEGAPFSSGKSRCAQALTLLGGGAWLAAATIPFLKSVRDTAPIIVGVDEGDEQEKDSPGIKGYLLTSHDWDATYGKFSDGDGKTKRHPEEIRFGGPVFITFRKKPWPAIVSRAMVFTMERSKNPAVSDDGDGEGMKRLLAPAAAWLKRKCEEALLDRDETWALLRTHEPDFIRKLDRVSKNVEVLRQRGKARTLLFIAEMIGADLEGEIRGALEEEELESESQVLIEAILADPLFEAARVDGGELAFEDLRLNVQKKLRDGGEYGDVTRSRFGSVLEEMGFSKKTGPTWKRAQKGGKRRMVLLPALWWRSGGGSQYGTTPYGEPPYPPYPPDPIPEQTGGA